MKKVPFIAAIVLVLIAALINIDASAENRKGAVSISPHVGGYIFESWNQKSIWPVAK